ncbi:hypothetical protein NL676_008862 [Syzygium grande]|nr:hypothetical protein NL676_008862 [Syzygium grande]
MADLATQAAVDSPSLKKARRPAATPPLSLSLSLPPFLPFPRPDRPLCLATAAARRYAIGRRLAQPRLSQARARSAFVPIARTLTA